MDGIKGISKERLRKINYTLLRNILEKEWKEAYGSLRRHEVAAKASMAGREAMKCLLTLALLGGAVTVAAVAPNVFAVARHDRRMYIKNPEFRRRLRYMRRQKYITMAGESDVLSVNISERGKFWLLAEFIGSSRRNEKKAKDGKLRIVIFDIPRRHNSARNALREHFRKMGMERLQASVYLSRFACEEKVSFLSKIWNVSGFINIIYADNIERMG